LSKQTFFATVQYVVASFLGRFLYSELKSMKNSRPFGKLVSLLLIGAFAGVAFAQLDVPRRTTAITYPLDEQVLVQFRGTTRFPRMKGDAKMRRTSRNGTAIEL